MRNIRIYSTVVAIAVSLAAVQSVAQAETVFAVNYDVRLNIDETEGHIQMQSMVRSGHSIPVDFGRHKVDLQITDLSSKKYLVVVFLSEKTDDGWYVITTDPPQFEGEYGIPVQFNWSSGDVALDIALAASPAPR